MTNKIRYLIDEIKLSIHPEILKLGFEGYTSNGLKTIDKVIEELIIQAKVLVDCNLISGQVQIIPLLKKWMQRAEINVFQYSRHISMYQIPEEARSNLPIINVISIRPNALYGTYGAILPSHNTYTLHAMNKNALWSHNGQQFHVMPAAKVFNGNLIRLDSEYHVNEQWSAECLLGHERNFSNLPNGVLKELKKVCVAATKRWLYINLDIAIEQGVINLGQDLGRIRDIISDYSDAEEQYEEYINNFQGAHLMNDPERLRKLWRSFVK